MTILIWFILLIILFGVVEEKILKPRRLKKIIKEMQDTSEVVGKLEKQWFHIPDPGNIYDK